MTVSRTHASGAREEREPVDPAVVKELFFCMMDAEDADAPDAEDRKSAAAQALADASAQVRAAAQALLAAHSRATGRLLDDPAPPGPTLPAPKIEGYEIRAEIGRGGFGIVYEAEQLRPVRREVAVKVLRADVASDATASRFRTEAAVLARLQHPGIASVFDAGFDTMGRAYLAVELIRGEPITAYCARRQLNVRDRVRLMAAVCDAVHHAHQRAVLHRDLKPANILVHDVDGAPTPKVIDFGIAKLVDQDNPELTTLDGRRLGTPKYMTPEQLDGAPVADTSADVFALGRVLCEILAGGLPADSPTGASTRARRSTSSSGSKPSAISEQRNPPAACRPAELRGDLDRIVLKATAHDPSLRYNSAAALSEDLHRYLRGEAVRATPPRRLYLIRKFVGRHPVGVAGATAASALVLAALLAAIQGQRVAEAARGRAVEAAERAERASEFILRDMVAATDPVMNFALDREPTIADLLGMVETSVSAGHLDDPRMEFDLLAHVAIGHAQLRRRDDALRMANTALELGRSLEPAPVDRMLELELTAIDADRDLSREDAAKARGSLLARASQELGDDHPVTMRLALAASRDDADAARRLETLQRLSRQEVDAEVRYNALVDRASLLRAAGRFEEEIEFRRAAIESARRFNSPFSTKVLGSRHQLAVALTRAERYEEAQRTLAPLLRIDDADVRARHPGFVSSAYLAISLHQLLGQHEEAIGFAERIAAQQRDAFGEESFERVVAVKSLALALHRGGRHRDAIATYEQALEICERTPGVGEDLREELKKGLAEARDAATGQR